MGNGLGPFRRVLNFVRVELRVCLYMCVLMYEYEFNLGYAWMLGKSRIRKRKRCFID